MKKARKPISLLLALVMAVSLAATPAFAGTPVALGTTARDVVAADDATFTPKSTGLYIVNKAPKAITSNEGAYTAADVTGTTVNEGSEGAYWLSRNFVYKFDYDNAQESVTVTAARTLGSVNVPAGGGVYVFDSGEAGLYKLTGTYKDGSGTPQDYGTSHISIYEPVTGDGQPLTADSTTGYYTLKANTSYAVKVTQGGGAPKLSRVTPVGNGSGATYTYKEDDVSDGGTYNFKAPSTGLYTLTITSTYTHKVNGKNVTEKNNSAMEVKIADSTGDLSAVVAAVSTKTTGETVTTFFLVKDTVYTVTATPKTAKGTDTTKTYTDKFTLSDRNSLNATGGTTLKPTSHVIFGGTDSTASDYTPIYFMFAPSADGWYRISAGMQGTLALEEFSSATINFPGRDKAAGSDISAAFTATTGNANNEKAYSLGASGYYEKEKVYFFKFTPAMGNDVKGLDVSNAKTNAITPAITIAKDKVDATLSGNTVTCSGMKQGGISVVCFKPVAGGELSLRFDPTPNGNSPTALSGVKVYDEKGAEVTGTTWTPGSTGGNSLGGTVTGTFTQGEVYYIAMTATDEDNPPASCKITVQQEDAVTVYPGISGVTVNLTEGTKNTKLDYKDATGTAELEPLTIGQTYTVTASAPGYFDASTTFTAKSTNNLELRLVAKPTLATGKYTGSEGKLSYTVPNGNVLTVDVTNKDVAADATDGQYWVGISIPQATVGSSTPKYYYGTGTYPAGSTGTEVKEANSGSATGYEALLVKGSPSGSDSIYVDAFSGGSSTPKSYWIRVAYTDTSVVIYQLNMKSGNVTKDTSASNPSDIVADPVPSAYLPSAENKVTGRGNTINKDGTDIVSSVKIGDKVPSPLAASLNKLTKDKDNLAKKGWAIVQAAKPYDGQVSEKNKLTSDCFIFYNGYPLNQDNVLTAEQLEAVHKKLDQVLVRPLLKVNLTNYVESKGSSSSGLKCDSFTVDINAYTRVLVTSSDGKTAIGNTDLTKSITQFKDPTNANSVYKRSELMVADTKTSGNSNTKVDENEQINAVQIGADAKVTVNDPIELTINLGSLDRANGNSVYVLHKHGGDTYEYEIKSDKIDSSKNATFVSAHGLSEFTFNLKGTNTAAYIERTINGQPCRIWYATYEDAIADALHGETITEWEARSTNIAGANRMGASSLTFAPGRPEAKLTGSVTINGSAVAMDEAKQNGVWNGKAQGVDPSTNNRLVLKQATGGTAKVVSNTLNPDEGDVVQISVTAASGYACAGLTVTPASGTAPSVTTVSTSGSTTVYSFKMPAAKVTVTPVFSKTSADVVTVKNTNAKAGELKVDNNKPALNATVTVTAEPETGYQLNSIRAYNTSSGKNVILTKVSENKYTFKMLSGGVTLEPTWATSNTVSIVELAGGEVTASDVEAKPGAAVTLTASPASGYMLTSIQVRGAGDTPIVTTKSGSRFYFTMPASGGVTVTPAWRLSSAPMPYTDPIAEWAKPYVDYAYRTNLMTGTTATRFGGSDYITRGEIWTILARYDGFYPKSSATPWYAEARAWAMNKATPSGGGYVSDGSSGETNISREQLATMLWRYAGSPTSSQSLAAFPDANQIHSSWSGFEPAMRWCVEKGILSGKDNGGGKLYLDPTGNATRNEVAKMIAQFAIST